MFYIGFPHVYLCKGENFMYLIIYLVDKLLCKSYVLICWSANEKFSTKCIDMNVFSFDLFSKIFFVSERTYYWLKNYY